MVPLQSVFENIKKFKDVFLRYRDSKEGRRIEENIRRRAREIKNLLEKESLKNFDEASLLTLAKNLYASGWWTK